MFTSNLISRTTWLKVKLKLVNFLWRPLIFHMPCLVRLSLIFYLKGTIDSAISFQTLWTIFLAGEDQQQTNQPNDLAGG